MALSKPLNRWWIAVAGTLLQLCLGTVYAWSYFQKPLVDGFQWSNTQVAWAFSIAICCLGLAAAVGGLLLPRTGPRRLAVLGGLLFGAGYLLAALALHFKSLALLYVGYGVVGGSGLGLGYVTPVATAAKWFPDKKGLVTGMVIMGFGFGALLMSKVIAPWMMAACEGNLVAVFGLTGAAFVVLPALFGAVLRNPPPGYAVAGAAARSAGGAHPLEDRPAGEHLTSRAFAMMWAVFFCNIVAGISIIGFQSPLFQDLWKRLDLQRPAATLAAYGATLIAVSSVFNGLGRLFWGGLSDRIGRVWTFRVMLASQAFAFVLLMRVANPWVFGALICYVLLCYGGGFGTMPSFVLDTFGANTMALVYGTILTAWSAAGIVGPQLVAALKDRYGAGASMYAFAMGAAFLAAGFVLSMALSARRKA